MGRSAGLGRAGAVALVLALIAAPAALGATAAAAATPPPVITSPTEGELLPSDSLVTFEGTGAALGTVVRVFVDGSEACVAEGDEDGAWSCASDAGISDGDHTAVAQQTVDAEVATSAPVNYSIGSPPPVAPSLACAYTPGSVSISTGDAAGVSVSLYSVAPGDSYTPEFSGDCSGPGTPFTGPFLDTFVDGCDLAPGDACDFSDLGPGIWNLYYNANSDEGGEGGASFDYFFTIPATPEAPVTTPAEGAIGFSGSGVTGDLASVLAADGALVCTATVVDSAWSCSTATTDVTAREYSTHETDAASGGVSALSAAVTAAGLPVTVPPTELPAEQPPVDVPAELPGETVTSPPTTAAPAVSAAVTPPASLKPVVVPRARLVWTLTVGGISGPIRPGQSVTLSSSGLPAGSTVSAELHSTPVALGTTTVAADGTFALAALIPLDIEAGDHHFVVTVTEPGEEPSVTETAVTIDPPEIVAASDASDDSTTDDSAAATTNALSLADGPIDPRDVPGAPNSLSTSLAPAWDVLSSPVAIGTSVIAGLAFLVLVAFPSELLGAAIQRRYTAIHRVGRVLPQSVGTWFARHPVFSGVGAIALATLITGFSDPAFGGDVASVRLLVACFIAAIIVSYGTYVLLGWFLNRRWALPTSLNLRPFTLVITVVGVVLSRVLDFSPGFLFGMMLSLTFPPAATVAVRSHARLLRTCLIVLIAVVSWFGYSAVLVTGGAPTDFGSALLQDTLAALSTEGLTGMLIGMLPFLYLDGRDIWKHSKRSWAGVYALVVFVFFLVVAPKPTNWADLGEKYGPWALVLGTYAVVALAAYFALHRSELKRAASLAAGAAAEPRGDESMLTGR